MRGSCCALPVFDPLAVSTDLGGKVDEREHHREEGAVAVNVEVLALVPLAAEDAEHAVEVRRPEHELGAHVTFAFLDGRARVTVDGRYVSGNRDLDFRAPYVPNAQVKLGDYMVLNVAASYAVSDTVEVIGRVSNALDADYEELDGYQTQGVAAYAGLRVRF